mgnify:CR=1 FL=1
MSGTPPASPENALAQGGVSKLPQIAVHPANAIDTKTTTIPTLQKTPKFVSLSTTIIAISCRPEYSAWFTITGAPIPTKGAGDTPCFFIEPKDRP